MRIGDVFRNVKKDIKIKDLIPVNELRNESSIRKYLGNTSYESLSFEEIEAIVGFLNEPLEYFYFAEGHGFEGVSFLYLNGLKACRIPVMELSFLKSLNFDKSLTRFKEKIEEKEKEKDYTLIFGIIDEGVAMDLYFSYFDQVPDEQKYDIFIHLYITMEYGFTDIDKEFMKKALSFGDRNDMQKKLMNFIDIQTGYVRVYRGVTSNSTDINDAHSWTLSKKTAGFFATRFGSDGDIYSADIHISDILAYITERNEEEIILSPEKLMNVQNLNYYKLQEVLDLLKDEDKLDDLYVNSVNTNRYESLFPRNGVHEATHSKRVTLLSLTMGAIDGLEDEDLNVLRLAAMYHDIGRTHDGECEIHGELSYERVMEEGFVDELDIQDLMTFEFMVKNHCVTRPQALRALKKSKIEDKDRAYKLYKYLCDADSLDRVRLGDFDDKYLNTETSIKLILVAEQLAKGLN